MRAGGDEARCMRGPNGQGIRIAVAREVMWAGGDLKGKTEGANAIRLLRDVGWSLVVVC